MGCISPINIARPNGEGNKDRITVPCNKCVFCLVQRQKDWAFRLEKEWKYSNTAKFLTLTYDEDHIPKSKEGHQTLEVKDLQLWMKRLRKSNLKKAWKYFPKVKTQAELLKMIPKIRYYNIGEYGSETWRPHYHSIMFNLNQDTIKNIDKTWKNGNIHVGEVSPQSILYVTKYVVTKNWTMYTEDQQKPFSTMSRKPGLGEQYTQIASDYHQQNLKSTCINSQGKQQKLPKFYMNKMFSKADKENISQKNNSLYSISQEKEFQRLKKMGLNPFKYQQEQQQILINKLEKNSIKTDKL